MSNVATATHIPERKGHWLWGSLPEFRRDMLRFFTDAYRENGSIVQFRLGSRRMVLVSDPAAIEEVLVQKNKSFRKHYGARLLRPVLGNGLLLSEGKAWLRQRRLIQPAFSRRFFTDFAEVVQQQASQLATQWQAQPDRDLYHDMTELTVTIAARAFLGVDELESIELIGDCLETIHADFEHRFQQFYSPPAWIPTKKNRTLNRTVATLTSIIDRMIDRRHDATDRHDALSLLLAARDEHGQQMPRKLLRDEVMTLLLAGHDTTANALTWTLYLLAQHAEIANQLAREAASQKGEAALTTHGGVTDDRTGAIVKESMRLYPPVYLFGRQATTETTIAGQRIRKGCNVIMSQWVVHRDEKFYANPLSFEPERWTTEFEESLPKYAYFPFGGGPRVCLGKDAALIEASIILKRLVGEFEITLTEPKAVKPWPTVTLRPEKEVAASVRRRNTIALPTGQSNFENSPVV